MGILTHAAPIAFPPAGLAARPDFSPSPSPRLGAIYGISHVI